MPQFDTFIFSSVLFYFIIGFLIFLYINAQLFLPCLGAILKLRYKLELQHKTLELQETVIPLNLEDFPLNSNKIQE
jgi:Plant ATP synthase F0